MLWTKLQIGTMLVGALGLVGVGLAWPSRIWAAPVPAREAVAKEDKGMTEPNGVPLELRLVAKKDTYAAAPHLVGKTAEEVIKLPPWDVDLEVELRNTGNQELRVCVLGSNRKPGAAAVGFDLDLKGPGAHKGGEVQDVNTVFGVEHSWLLAPGKSRTFSIKKLYAERCKDSTIARTRVYGARRANTP